ncbi:unnamed protein product, partial [Rotaria sp. Silwood2]
MGRDRSQGWRDVAPSCEHRPWFGAEQLGPPPHQFC